MANSKNNKTNDQIQVTAETVFGYTEVDSIPSTTKAYMKELCETCEQCHWVYGACDGCTEEEYNGLLERFGQEFIDHCNETEIW